MITLAFEFGPVRNGAVRELQADLNQFGAQLTT